MKKEQLIKYLKITKRIIRDELNRNVTHTPTLKKKKFVNSSKNERKYIELDINSRHYITLK